MTRNYQYFLLIIISLLSVDCTRNGIKSDSEHSQIIKHYTNDFENVLSEEEKIKLDRTLSDLEDSVGSQIVIITSSLNGEPIEDYSLRTANKIKTGRKGYNDGILITLAPYDRTTQIEVGYGLECIIADSVAQQIIDTKMIPFFRTGKYFEGLEASINDLSSRLYENQSKIGYCESNPDYDGEKIIIE